MNEEKFREDTKGKCHEFGLIEPEKRILQNYERKLGNKSITQGLAFTIEHANGKSVEGICHNVPVGGLGAFLRKEGVISDKNDPSYKLIMVSIEGESRPVLTLEGLKHSSLNELKSKKNAREKMSKLYVMSANLLKEPEDLGSTIEIC